MYIAFRYFSVSLEFSFMLLEELFSIWGYLNFDEWLVKMVVHDLNLRVLNRDKLFSVSLRPD